MFGLKRGQGVQLHPSIIENTSFAPIDFGTFSLAWRDIMYQYEDDFFCILRFEATAAAMDLVLNLIFRQYLNNQG